MDFFWIIKNLRKEMANAIEIVASFILLFSLKIKKKCQEK